MGTERRSWLEDGRLLYRLEHRWRDGTTHVVFAPHGLVEKLAALVPPPRFHLVRYRGILGPCAGARDRVVPCSATPEERARLPRCKRLSMPAARRRAPRRDPGRRRAGIRSPILAIPCVGKRLARFRRRPTPREPLLVPDASTLRPRQLAWAELLRRVFAVDVLECPRCGARMRLLAAIQPPDVTRAILECLDLPSRAPPTAAPIPDPDDAEEWPGEFEATL